MKYLLKNLNAIVLLIIALLYFIVLSILIPFPENYTHHLYILPDSLTYLNAAKLIYKSGFTFDPTRPFGYPILIGLPYLAGISGFLSILKFSVFINICCWLLSVLFLYKTIKQLINGKTAFYITLIFIFTFSYIYFIYQAMTESLFTLLVILFSYCLMRYFEAKKYTFLLASLFFLCYSVVVRPISFYICTAFFVYCIWLAFKNKDLRLFFLSIIIFTSTIGLQMGMIYRESGKFAISFIQNYTMDRFLITRAAYLKEKNEAAFKLHSYDNYQEFLIYYNKKWDPKDSVYNAITNEHDIIRYWATSDGDYKKDIANELRNDKTYFFKSYLYNLLENVKNGSFFPRLITWEQKKKKFEALKTNVNNITSFQNKVFCSLMFIMSLVVFISFLFHRPFRNRDLIFTGILNIIMIYLFLASGISFWQADRFNIVWYPLLMICFPCLFKYLLTKFKKQGMTSQV